MTPISSEKRTELPPSLALLFMMALTYSALNAYWISFGLLGLLGVSFLVVTAFEQVLLLWEAWSPQTSLPALAVEVPSLPETVEATGLVPQLA
ncbi:hypothetical protein [Deinococcus hopiensis]|uniref:Uncharacterized protein n=1 Tax=Deinococcus hopiensis KR-140 TaxID=695939 RepID=A0A1W1VDB7_9DEIO|nr:hypothetical protein [Deinococcus hopiensis]SMB91200.1 hypothetical protein SAMN00790413_01036 [Deinococcus hopiensis KR-140]